MEGADERKKNFWYKTPFFRGFLILIDSMSIGYRALLFSGDIADPDAGPRNPFVENIIIFVALLIALVVFKFIPIFLTNLIFGFGISFAVKTDAVSIGQSVGFSAVEGVIKAGVLVTYMLSIRRIKDVRRVFQYHGAEHKTINAYEAGSDLSVDDIVKYPTFHPRCGTSFLFAVILISLLVACFFPLITLGLFGNPQLALNLGVRFAMHIIFLPIISSIGYEFIRFTARFNPNSLFMKILITPGELFQKITSLEPEKNMLEVSRVSMHLAMGLEGVDAPDPEQPSAQPTEDRSPPGK